MSSGTTAQDPTWKSRETAEEARYMNEKEKSQLAAIRQRMQEEEASKKSESESSSQPHPAGGHDFEGGFGGQENLEDRYATTLGEH